MALSLLRDAIQNALVTAVKNGVFYQVSVSPTTWLSSTNTTTPINPIEVNANELNAAFGEELNRRALTDDRTLWSWEVRATFAVFAACEVFEQSLSKPLVVRRDPANGIDRQVVLRFKRSSYKHPPEQQPSQGTRVVYTFDAALSPL